MDPAEYAIWQLETKLIEDQLVRVEQAQRSILESMQCPTHPVAIYAILNREQPEPWPKRMSERNRNRARFAMHALLYVGETRRHIAANNSRCAAYFALLAGALAGDTLAIIENEKAVVPVVKWRKKGAAVRGKQIAEAAKRHDLKILKEYRRWQQSDDLQDQYRGPAPYIASRLDIPLRAVQHAVKRLTNKR